MTTRVKICGLMRRSDAEQAAGLGVDYLGVVLTPGFSRSVSLRDAAAIFGRLDVRRVGVFVDAPSGYALRAALELNLDVLQLHGCEPAEEVVRLSEAGPWQVWKAVRVGGSPGLDALPDYAGPAAGVVVDAGAAGHVGGSGQRYQWDGVGARVRDALPSGLFVAAGGLAPDNVASAVLALDPDVVDVSSGVERELGRKDPELIRAFVNGAAMTGVDDAGLTPGTEGRDAR